MHSVDVHVDKEGQFLSAESQDARYGRNSTAIERT
jgi:hypothetical protein